MLAAAFFVVAAIAFGDDFKTIDGKEYKNVTVSRVEPDGIVLTSSSGISKVYFTELPKEVQERFHYDQAKSAAYSAQQNANLEALREQQEVAAQRAAEQKAAVAAQQAAAYRAAAGAQQAAAQKAAEKEDAILDQRVALALSTPWTFPDPFNNSLSVPSSPDQRRVYERAEQIANEKYDAVPALSTGGTMLDRPAYNQTNIFRRHGSERERLQFVKELCQDEAFVRDTLSR